MKILVIGSGGREHAICWKLSQSRSVDKIYCCPCNAGIAQIAECISVNQNDFQALLDFVKYEWIDLTIVGPEDPLSRGIVDLFERDGRSILFLPPTDCSSHSRTEGRHLKPFEKQNTIFARTVVISMYGYIA